ncbi:MAG: DUF1877 family protein [Polyangiaceae bacterium]|nr:DUF1877 family protein [Polyangiaceae bacterium]
MSAVLCTLSSARLAKLDATPDLVRELLEARHDTQIPGLLDLGKTWDALRILLEGERAEGPIGDAIVARTGRQIGPRLEYGRARVLDAKRVREVAAALEALPEGLVEARYATLASRDAHGGWGKDVIAPRDPKYVRERAKEAQAREKAELGAMLERVRALYKGAAAAGHAMLSVIV